MSLLKVIYLCIALLISPYHTYSFPEVPNNYVTSECREGAETFTVQNVPLAYDSALFCMYQNLQVLLDIPKLQLALTTPHTGRSICGIEVHSFDNDTKTFNMTIYDTDLQGNCTRRNGTVNAVALENGKTKQRSELRIPRKLGRTRPYFQKEKARLLFTEYKTCLIFITSFYGEKYCELFVVRNDSINMHDTPCHSIYRIYCGYGSPTRDVWPNPIKSSSDEDFILEAHTLRMLIQHAHPLKEDTIFMNEFQMITKVLYHIPEANVYASTYEKREPRLCGIQTYKIMPDRAELVLQRIINGRNKSEYGVPHYYSDTNAISPTQIFLSDHYGLRRVLLSNFKSCYVLKKVDKNKSSASSCELFVKNNTDPTTDLEECWFVFLVYCGYPKAFYNETSCYSRSIK
ncbi:uncharacterized protein LOC120837609 [Ixodes scapularis]|uniref:uncharacterized protein LOC120837609 n=1 Tax=Ixodes scapularis TaxID=6945 RepID=UPI001A9F330F|nr:uncharacterized protein LOC120837609 [Ixodes scapularis]